MCTVTWLHERDGYELFFNRDERRTRKPASPPTLRELRGVWYTAPADGDHGGSWIGVNELGLSLCLLNSYDVPAGAPPAGDWTSRGLLLLDLMDSPSRAAVCDRLAGADLADYQPFTLAVFEAGAPALAARSDGCTLRIDPDASPPLVSSSFDFAAVDRARRRQLRRAGALDQSSLRLFHGSHLPAPGPFSVCMHREDAETVSFSRVRVDAETIVLEYQDGAPCMGHSIVSTSLPRVRPRAPGRSRP
jgi:hypothetical protein